MKTASIIALAIGLSSCATDPDLNDDYNVHIVNKTDLDFKFAYTTHIGSQSISMRGMLFKHNTTNCKMRGGIEIQLENKAVTFMESNEITKWEIVVDSAGLGLK